jgi:hypothetical protein
MLVSFIFVLLLFVFVHGSNKDGYKVVGLEKYGATGNFW